MSTINTRTQDIILAMPTCLHHIIAISSFVSIWWTCIWHLSFCAPHLSSWVNIRWWTGVHMCKLTGLQLYTSICNKYKLYYVCSDTFWQKVASRSSMICSSLPASLSTPWASIVLGVSMTVLLVRRLLFIGLIEQFSLWSNNPVCTISKPRCDRPFLSSLAMTFQQRPP